MMNTSPGRIFLSEKREITESASLKCYSTFCNDRSSNGIVLSLLLMNDETLAGAAMAEYRACLNTHVIIIPVTGSFDYKSYSEITPADAATVDLSSVEVEEILIATLPAGSIYSIWNPYPTDSVNYLHLQVKAGTECNAVRVKRCGFSLAGPKNAILDIETEEKGNGSFPFSISLIQLEGRKEAVYKLKRQGSYLFTFAVAGAFELEGRLLHPGDGLALWDIPQYETEALSNNALLLSVELFNKQENLQQHAEI